jgi:aspartate-semialdehyde dehydrogenase
MDGLAAGSGDPPAASHQAFPAPIAFNVIPQAGSVKGDGYTSEEVKMATESRKILGLPSLEVTATCVRVPTFVGHGAAVWARFHDRVDVGQALACLAGAPGVELADLPTAQLAAGHDPSYVGRVRSDLSDPHALCFFCTCDNLRKGAALNAIQIAERLLPV